MSDISHNLHLINMVLVLATGTITGVWGLILYFRKINPNRPWRISLIVTAIVGLLQAVLGLWLVFQGYRPTTGGSLYYLHYVYGAIVALGIPVAITYATGGKDQRRDLLIFSIVALIMAAAGVRAMMTGLGIGA